MRITKCLAQMMLLANILYLDLSLDHAHASFPFEDNFEEYEKKCIVVGDGTLCVSDWTGYQLFKNRGMRMCFQASEGEDSLDAFPLDRQEDQTIRKNILKEFELLQSQEKTSPHIFFPQPSDLSIFGMKPLTGSSVHLSQTFYMGPIGHWGDVKEKISLSNVYYHILGNHKDLFFAQEFEIENLMPIHHGTEAYSMCFIHPEENQTTLRSVVLSVQPGACPLIRKFISNHERFEIEWSTLTAHPLSYEDHAIPLSVVQECYPPLCTFMLELNPAL